MKKLLLFAVALLATMFATTHAQTVVDLGSDWDTSSSTLVSASSGATLALSAAVTTFADTVNAGQATQVIFSLDGAGSSSVTLKDAKSVYANPMSSSISYVYLKTTQTDYFQVDATSSKKITAVKINGTSASTTAYAKAAVVYSSATPFDASKIVGFDTLTLAICRAGNAGTTLSTNIPDGTKSFRIYRGVYLTQLGSYYVLDATTPGTLYGATGLTRVAYIAVTLNDATSGISEETSDKVIVSREYYDLLGKKLSTCPTNTISIVKNTYEDGRVSFNKTLLKK